jgi:hypothetical protein
MARHKARHPLKTLTITPREDGRLLSAQHSGCVGIVPEEPLAQPGIGQDPQESVMKAPTGHAGSPK